MVSKIKVHGKAQNRTALGIMHAFMVMNPQANMEELQKAFPDSLNPDSGVKKIFVEAGEKASENWNGFFQKEDELLTMGNNKKVAVVSMWTKPSFQRLVERAKEFGIEVASFEEAEKGIGKKGSWNLEFLNGYVPPIPTKTLWWKWALMALFAIIALIILYFLLRGCGKKAEPQTIIIKDTVVKVEVVKDTIIKVDTVYYQAIEEIEKNFNAARFVVGKADLNEDAKFVLHDLAKIMQKHPEVKLLLQGHTSAEGDSSFNQKLSEARAQAAVDFLVNHEGIDTSRLKAEGKGSSMLKNPDSPTADENRRTEFIVIDKEQ